MPATGVSLREVADLNNTDCVPPYPYFGSEGNPIRVTIEWYENEQHGMF